MTDEKNPAPRERVKALLRRLLVRGAIVGGVAACTSCIVMDPLPPQDAGVDCHDDAGNPEPCKMTPAPEQPDGGVADDGALEGGAPEVDPAGQGEP